MILLDTNVLSEALRPAPSDKVVRWLAGQEPSDVFITAITLAELLYGVEAMTPGRRRTQLLAAVTKMLDLEFEGRILPFDTTAAREFAKIGVVRQRSGRPISQFDAMIAAIARLHGATLATRNVSDFQGCGIQIVNPWEEDT